MSKCFECKYFWNEMAHVSHLGEDWKECHNTLRNSLSFFPEGEEDEEEDCVFFDDIVEEDEEDEMAAKGWHIVRLW